MRVTRPLGDVPVAVIVHSSPLVFVAEYVPEPPSSENVVLASVDPMGWVPVESCWLSTASALLRPASAVFSARATSRSRAAFVSFEVVNIATETAVIDERPHDDECEHEGDTPFVAEPQVDPRPD